MRNAYRSKKGISTDAFIGISLTIMCDSSVGEDHDTPAEVGSYLRADFYALRAIVQREQQQGYDVLSPTDAGRLAAAHYVCQTFFDNWLQVCEGEAGYRPDSEFRPVVNGVVNKRWSPNRARMHADDPDFNDYIATWIMGHVANAAKAAEVAIKARTKAIEAERRFDSLERAARAARSSKPSGLPAPPPTIADPTPLAASASLPATGNLAASASLPATGKSSAEQTPQGAPRCPSGRRAGAGVLALVALSCALTFAFLSFAPIGWSVDRAVSSGVSDLRPETAPALDPPGFPSCIKATKGHSAAAHAAIDAKNRPAVLLDSFGAFVDTVDLTDLADGPHEARVWFVPPPTPPVEGPAPLPPEPPDLPPAAAKFCPPRGSPAGTSQAGSAKLTAWEPDPRDLPSVLIAIALDPARERITMNARVCGASAVLALTQCVHVGVPEPVNPLVG